MMTSKRTALLPAAVAVAFSLCVSANAYALATVTRSPYLQSQSESSTTLRWRTDIIMTGIVRYGITQGLPTFIATELTPSTDHTVTLIGLTANTKYYYALTDSSFVVLAGDDANHFFITSPAIGTKQPTRIWALGDSGTKDASQRSVRDGATKWMNNNPWLGSTRPDLWLMLGDNAYPAGEDSQYQLAVFDVYPTFLRNSPLWPCIGNHDASAAGFSSGTETGPYFDIFTLPANAEAGGVVSGTEAYYSFDYANIHFLVLDSANTSLSATGPMAIWADSDIKATSQDWVIAYWHHPPYTKGSHDSDVEGRLISMRQNFLPILESAGVDLVLTGHSHTYERSYLLDQAYGSSTAADNLPANAVDSGDGQETGTGAYLKATVGTGPNEGTVYVVNGASGSARGGDPNVNGPHTVMFTSIHKAGSMVIDVDDLRLDAYYIDNIGATLDSFTIKKGGAVDATIPSVIQAIASGNPTQVDVVFSERVEAGAGLNGAENIANYSIPGFTVTGATLNANGRTVTLTLSTLMSDGVSYSLTVTDVNDIASPPNMLVSQVVNFTFTAGPVTVIAQGDTWRYFKGFTFPGAAWTQIGFNDSAWFSGPTGIGYGDGDDATVLSDMQGGYVTVYMRKSFNVADTATVTALTLTVDYDDGYVAYLNGVEVVRSAMPVGPVDNMTLSTGSSATVDGGILDVVDLSGFFGDLVTGTNVLAIELHNVGIGSSDATMIPILDMTGGFTADNTPPTVSWATLDVAITLNDLTITAGDITVTAGTVGALTSGSFSWSNIPTSAANSSITVTDSAGNAAMRTLTLTP